MEEYLEKVRELEEKNTATKEAIGEFCQECIYPEMYLKKFKVKKCDNPGCSLFKYCPFTNLPETPAQSGGEN